MIHCLVLMWPFPQFVTLSKPIEDVLWSMFNQFYRNFDSLLIGGVERWWGGALAFPRIPGPWGGEGKAKLAAASFLPQTDKERWWCHRVQDGSKNECKTVNLVGPNRSSITLLIVISRCTLGRKTGKKSEEFARRPRPTFKMEEWCDLLNK